MLEKQDEPGRLLVGQRLDQERVDEGEDRGRGADTESQGQNADKGKERIFNEKAESVANFLEHDSAVRLRQFVRRVGRRRGGDLAARWLGTAVRNGDRDIGDEQDEDEERLDRAVATIVRAHFLVPR